MSQDSEFGLAEQRYEPAKERFQALDRRFRVVEREADELRRRFMSFVSDHEDARPKTPREMVEIRLFADLGVVWQGKRSEMAALEEEYDHRRDAIARKYAVEEGEIRRRYAPQLAEFDAEDRESGEDQDSGLVETPELQKSRSDMEATLRVLESVRSDRILARRELNAAREARNAVRER